MQAKTDLCERSPDIVILAAGLGTRLREISGDLPKALVKAGRYSLLDRALAFANKLSSHGQIYVVGGYRFDLLERHQRECHLQYRLFCNPHFRRGNLWSLLTALPHVRSSFYVINADHIFPLDSAQFFKPQNPGTITAFCDSRRELFADDMKVQLDDDREHIKKINKSLSLFHVGYIGVSYIPHEWITQYTTACEALPTKIGDNACVEQALQYLADSGIPIVHQLFDADKWFEVDTPEDYEHLVRALETRGEGAFLSLNGESTWKG